MRHVLGPAQAAHRDRPLKATFAGQEAFDEVGHQRCVDEAGGHRVDRDPPVGHLEGKGAGEALEARLRRGVAALPPLRIPGADGGYDDDPPKPLSVHPPQDQVGHGHSHDEVLPNPLLMGREVRGQEQGVVYGSGGVHEDRRRSAELCLDGDRKAPAVLVAPKAARYDADGWGRGRVLESGKGGVCLLVILGVRQGEVVVLGEQPGGAQADARGSAGNQRQLARGGVSLLKTTQEFWPPNPKLLLRMTSKRWLRDSLGT